MTALKRRKEMNNTVKRTIFGAIFLILMVCGLVIHPYLYGVLLLLMVMGMMKEYYDMSLGKRYRLPRVLATLLAVGMFVSIFCVSAFGIPYKFVALNAILLLATMASTLFEKDKSDFRNTAFLYAGILYVAVPLSLSNLIVFHGGSFNGLLMLSFFIIIWASDIGAYCFGMLFGQKGGKKLWPSISPKKSWAGFWGGLLLALVAALILYFTPLVSIPLIHCLLMAAIMHVAGVFGDLFESQWKRTFDLKDSGHVIPGHGGLLDRFDSAIFAIPAGVIYLVIIGLM